MTLDKSVTDDQLGKYYRRTKAIADRLGKSLSFDEVMDALQSLHDGISRFGRNTAEDLQHFLQRPPKTNILRVVARVVVAAFPGKATIDCFNNKKRYPRVELERREGLCSLPDKLEGQERGEVEVFSMLGEGNPITLAAEVLGVPNEIPESWLEALLIKRGHTLALPCVEELVERQNIEEIGLAKYDKDVHHRSGNRAFVEIQPGRIEMVHFDPIKPRQWGISRYPFRDTTHGRTSYQNCGNQRLVIRI